MTSPSASAPLQDSRTLSRMWYEAMTRWQVTPDRLGARPTRPSARVDDADDVMLTDIDPALCAIRGWQ